jgi:hypothetical protein
MPYFRRGEGVEAGLPAVAAAVPSSVNGIVEKAAAILDGQPLPEINHLSDPQQRLSQLLASFLQVFAPASVPTAANAEPSLMKEIPSANASSMGVSRPSIPVIEVAAPITAGSVASLVLPLVNDGPSSVDAVPYSTDLISSTGHQIAAPQVTFLPRRLPLASGAHGTTELRVAIPEQTGPGKYSALVQAMGLDGPRAVVVLTVA